MKKRVLSLFMTLMLCLTSLPTTALAAELAAADSTPAVETVDGEGTSGETDTAGEAEARGGSGETEAVTDAESVPETRDKSGENDTGNELEARDKSGAAEAGREAEIRGGSGETDALPNAENASETEDKSGETDTGNEIEAEDKSRATDTGDGAEAKDKSGETGTGDETEAKDKSGATDPGDEAEAKDKSEETDTGNETEVKKESGATDAVTNADSNPQAEGKSGETTTGDTADSEAKGASDKPGAENAPDASAPYNETKTAQQEAAVEGNTLALEQCDHAEAVYEPYGDTQHRKTCAQCGYEGEPENCTFNSVDGYDQGDENGHYAKCICGNVDRSNPISHDFETLPTNDGQYHTSRCVVCGYTANGAGRNDHTWNYDTGECTVCGFAPVAEDRWLNLYDSVTDALEAVADGKGATDYVKLIVNSYTYDKITTIDESIVFDHPGATVELKTNGHTLTNAAGGPVLSVEGGTLRITEDAVINQTGHSQETVKSAIAVSGGTLILEGNLTAQGGTYNGTTQPAVYADGGELDFRGGLDLTGGLTLTGSAKLTHGLTQGTFQAEENDSSYRVSVDDSEEYENVYGLLEEGYGFLDSDTNKFVGGDDIVTTLVQNVTIAEHTHSYQPKDGADYYFCECGKTCGHDSGYTDGACSICGKPCSHTEVKEKADPETGDNITVCDTCGQQMLVRTDRQDGSQAFGTDFRTAMNEAGDGTTVTLLADINNYWKRAGSPGNKTVTLDLNGHTITDGWIDVGGKVDGKYISSTLKIIGSGNFVKTSIYGNIFLDLKGTLDLSGWTGGTICEISVQDDKNYKEDDTPGYTDRDREAGLIIEPDAGTIQRLQFGGWYLGEVTRTTLRGGNYNEIWVSSFGEVQLGDLLAEGYAFQYEDGSYVDYTRKFLDEFVYNLKVVKCPHEKVENGTCAYCGMTNIAAVVDSTAFHKAADAITAWLAGGTLLTLHADVDIPGAAWSAVDGRILNLNGYAITGGRIDLNDDMDLTIRDEDRTGKIDSLIVGNGAKLTLEGGTIASLNVENATDGNVKLRGGRVTGSAGEGGGSIPVYKLLEDGYYLEGSSLLKDPTDSFDGGPYEVKNADITISENKEGEAAVGRNIVPIEVSVTPADAAITTVAFDWYLVDTDGVKRLAGIEDVAVTDGTATYNPATAEKSTLSGWDSLEKKKDYSLICVATGKAGGTERWKTVMQGYTMHMLPPSLEDAEITFESGNAFVFWPDTDDNSKGAGTVAGHFTVTFNGSELEENTDFTVVDNSDLATAAGKYTLTIQGVDPNYSGTKTAEWEVVPHRLSSIAVTQGAKQYDGTDALPEGTVTNIFGSRETNYGGSITLKEGTDYEVTEAHFMTADASGEAKDFVVRVRLKNPNYVFADGTTENILTHADCNVTIEVNKADAPTAEADTLKVRNRHAGSYTVDLSALPTLKSPMEYGEVTYTIDTVDLDDSYYDAAKGKAAIEGDRLILPIQAVDTEEEREIGAITITASSTNVQDIILTIPVTAANKIVPQLEGELALSPAGITYGDRLDTIAITGTMKDGDREVPGTFTWTDGEVRPEVGDGTYIASWKFTPADTVTYEMTTGTTKVRVGRAAQGGKVSMKGYTYNDTVSTPGLTDRTGDSNATVTYYYSTGDTNSGGKEWKNIDPAALNAGIYYMYAGIGETANYSEHTTPAVKFEVGKAQPDYKKPVGVTAKCGQKLSEIQLINPAENMQGTWTWKAPDTVLDKTGEVEYYANFQPDDANYQVVTDIAVTVNVEAGDDKDLPKISAQPRNVSVKTGEKAVFEVTAEGTDLTYQWMIDRNDGKGFVAITGAAGAGYTTGATDLDCNGFRYYCVISNAAGSVTTDIVTLTVSDTAGPTPEPTATPGPTATPEPTTTPVSDSYRIIDGAGSSWTQNTDGSLAIRGNGEFTKFVNVKVDGQIIDPGNYTVTEGSTIITLKADYLKTLSEGSHTFEIAWTDGTASTSFTVAADTSGGKNDNDDNDGNTNNDSNGNTDSGNNADNGNNTGSNNNTVPAPVTAPKTGDASGYWILLFVISCAGFAGMLVRRKK